MFFNSKQSEMSKVLSTFSRHKLVLTVPPQLNRLSHAVPPSDVAKSKSIVARRASFDVAKSKSFSRIGLEMSTI